MTEKKAMISFFCITFFKSKASGSDKPIDPIIKAIAVPNGTPLSTKVSTTGKTPTASIPVIPTKQFLPFLLTFSYY